MKLTDLPHPARELPADLDGFRVEVDSARDDGAPQEEPLR